MYKFDWDFFIGCMTFALVVLGLTTAIYFDVQSTNAKYYASMDRCTAAGGSFIPTSQGNAICMMGVKQ